MMNWLEYPIDPQPALSLANAWQALEGKEAFLIATEPGCERFMDMAHIFYEGLEGIIIIGQSYHGAKAVIFCKRGETARGLAVPRCNELTGSDAVSSAV